MSTTTHKEQAKRLRSHLEGNRLAKLTHCQALNAIAAIHGHRNYQTMVARTSTLTGPLILAVSDKPLTPVPLPVKIADLKNLTSRIRDQVLMNPETRTQFDEAFKAHSCEVFSDGVRCFTSMGDFVCEIDVSDLADVPKPKKQMFVVLYDHRHGHDFYLIEAYVMPSCEEVIAALNIPFEPDRDDEFIEIGPVELSPFDHEEAAKLAASVNIDCE